MPTIFGHEVPAKTLWIGGGLIAAAVAVIVFLRSRAAANASDNAAPQPADQGGMSVSAPTGAVANDYQQQVDNSQLEAQKIANQYQQQLMGQQQKQFDLQQRLAQALLPSQIALGQAQYARETHFEKAAAGAAVSCPGSASLRTDKDGNLWCRQKTSGGFLGIPVGDIFRTVQNAIGGIEAAAPTLGYQVAQAAAGYGISKYLTYTPPAQGGGQAQARAPRAATPGIITGTLPNGALSVGVHQPYQETMI
jgi:hypothetical protein